MARSTRDRFEYQRNKIGDIDDDPTRDALHAFADAIDPEYDYAAVPKPGDNGGIERESKSNSTARNYLSALRCAYQRGLDLLDADVETVNHFMLDLVNDPENRRYDIVDYDGSIKKTSAKSWQSGLRAFYRFCTEPGVDADDRPDVDVEWPADDIVMFTERSDPKHDEEDMPKQADLDAMREACLFSQNTRRDRAFLELVAGTGQRIYALVTLRVKHVNLDADIPHILLNPEIDGNGDKGAIEKTGRWKPIVTDTGPIRKWIENHPLQDAEVRDEHDAPDDFEDCYLFVGSFRQRSTDPADHWGDEAARNTLNRRKSDTKTMSGVKTVDIPVNPHNWRHYAYTKSQALPIDESRRRKVFGWAKGSEIGDKIYGHESNKNAGKEFAEAWQERFGDEAAEGVAEQVVGGAAAGDVSPEVRQALVEAILGDDQLKNDLADAVVEAAK